MQVGTLSLFYGGTPPNPLCSLRSSFEVSFSRSTCPSGKLGGWVVHRILCHNRLSSNQSSSFVFLEVIRFFPSSILPRTIDLVFLLVYATQAVEHFILFPTTTHLSPYIHTYFPSYLITSTITYTQAQIVLNAQLVSGLLFGVERSEQAGFGGLSP